MKEEEARKKWCPFAIDCSNYDCDMEEEEYKAILPGNRYFLIDSNEKYPRGPRFPECCCCIASDCALWVWEQEFPTGDNMFPKYSKTEGYCGLRR